MSFPKDINEPLIKKNQSFPSGPLNRVEEEYQVSYGSDENRGQA